MPAKITTALTVAASIAFAPVTVALTATSASAAVKPNLRACYDGKCKITLTKSVSFKVSPKFGITRLAISFNSQMVSVKGSSAYVSSQAMLGRGASGSVNNIGVRILSLSSGKAVLRLTPKR